MKKSYNYYKKYSLRYKYYYYEFLILLTYSNLLAIEKRDLFL